jgi:hypothetical protein
MTDKLARRYLADGLYADYDGYQFRLYCDRNGWMHEVYLEVATVDALFSFIGECWDKRIVIAPKSADNKP